MSDDIIINIEGSGEPDDAIKLCPDFPRRMRKWLEEFGSWKSEYLDRYGDFTDGPGGWTLVELTAELYDLFPDEPPR